MITKEKDGSRSVVYSFPETSIEVDSEGQMKIRQTTWYAQEQVWVANTIIIPRDFFFFFVNGDCDVVGVM